MDLGDISQESFGKILAAEFLGLPTCCDHYEGGMDSADGQVSKRGLLAVVTVWDRNTHLAPFYAHRATYSA